MSRSRSCRGGAREPVDLHRSELPDARPGPAVAGVAISVAIQHAEQPRGALTILRTDPQQV
jgi:hypothetical protein